MEKEESLFEKLSKLNVNDKTEKKNNLTYLSWAWAWSEFKKNVPDATYDVVEYNGSPFCYDENLGYIVKTYVMAGGQNIPMHLPVLDGANKAMKNHPYTYKTKYGDKTVEAATMFDINTAIMRCLVKNIAMFGLAIYIYAGEDLPEVQDEAKKPVDVPKKPEGTPAKKDDSLSADKINALKVLTALGTPLIAKYIETEKLPYTGLVDMIKGETVESLREIYNKLAPKK